MARHKGCYFTENSMTPQCHRLWDRAVLAEAEIERLRRNLERTLALAVAKIGGDIRHYSSVEEVLILNDAKGKVP